MQKIEQLTPDDASNLCDMGLIYRQLGKYKESLTYLEKALMVHPLKKKFLMEVAVSYSVKFKETHDSI